MVQFFPTIIVQGTILSYVIFLLIRLFKSSKRRPSTKSNIQNKQSYLQSSEKPVNYEIRERIFNFLDENTLTIGTLEEFRKGQKDFDNWGSGVITGSKKWIMNKLSTKLLAIGAGGLNNISHPKDYSWQTSKLEGFTVKIEISIPNGMLAGYYIGRVGDDLFGLFGYGFDHDETESSASSVVKSIKLTEQNDGARAISVAMVALRWDFNPLSKQELRDRAAKAVQVVDNQFDKDVMDVKILTISVEKQYVQLSVRANFQNATEEEQIRNALKSEFMK